MKILITGGCGFIGHHFVEHFLKYSDYEIVIIDKLTYAARGFSRIDDIESYNKNKERVSIYTYDITEEISDGILSNLQDIDYILHLAAESHVDKSIENPKPFVMSNIIGTMNMLDFARKCNNLKGFCMFSTDEVFGPAPIGVLYREDDRYKATNPYAASKAGAEQLAYSYGNTYNLPVFITHTMNVIGERQHPEKFIPLCIRKILGGETIYIHSDSTKTISGSRYYIHARNVANGIHFLLDKFKQKEMYNIVGEKELSNIQIAEIIADELHQPLIYKMIDFHSSRPGHDLRYALDGSKMKEMGWTPPTTLEESLRNVVKWTINRKDWLY